jgi:hemoglobin
MKMKHSWVWCAMLLCVLVSAGCRSGKATAKKDEFFTSGSREADQRASQTMAKHEQLAGTGEGKGEKKVKDAEKSEKADKKEKTDEASGAPATGTNRAALVEGKLALYDRLGGDAGISNIVADFLPRALNDPRVNWERRGAARSGLLRRTKESEAQWNATPESVARLHKHFVQFLALASGGPAKYEGKDLRPSHANMKIGNPEFDAVIGDLKASLDKLQIPNKEQKELLALVESTRPQVVTQR